MSFNRHCISKILLTTIPRYLTLLWNPNVAVDNFEPSTVIGISSIVIHNPKKKSAEINTGILPIIGYSETKTYPNPFSERLRFEFTSPISTHALIDIYDMIGRKVQTVFDADIEGNVKYNTEFVPTAEISGMYLYRMTLGEEAFNGQV